MVRCPYLLNSEELKLFVRPHEEIDRSLALLPKLNSIYQSKQSVDEIEEVLGLGDNQALYGDAGFFDSVMITDVNANYRLSDELSIFGAINNVTDEVPYATQNAWPVGPRGRTFILGVSYSM